MLFMLTYLRGTSYSLPEGVTPLGSSLLPRVCTATCATPQFSLQGFVGDWRWCLPVGYRSVVVNVHFLKTGLAPLLDWSRQRGCEMYRYSCMLVPDTAKHTAACVYLTSCDQLLDCVQRKHGAARHRTTGSSRGCGLRVRLIPAKPARASPLQLGNLRPLHHAPHLQGGSAVQARATIPCHLPGCHMGIRACPSDHGHVTRSPCCARTNTHAAVTPTACAHANFSMPPPTAHPARPCFQASNSAVSAAALLRMAAGTALTGA